MGFRNTAFFLQRTQKNRHVPKPLNSALCFENNMTKKNITLVTLMMIIVLIFMAAIIPNYRTVEDTYLQRDLNYLRFISTKVEEYKKDNGVFPKKLTDLIPNYLKGIPKDSCGRSFNYNNEGKENVNSFDLWSNKCNQKHDGIANFEKT